MPVSTLLMAPALAFPELSPQNRQHINDAYPIWALRAEKVALVEVEFVVSPQGKVQTCNTVRYLGDATLASTACNAILRETVAPATDARGSPRYGLVSASVRYWIGDDAPSLDAFSDPDIEISLNRLPAGLVSPTTLQVAVLVNTEGSVVECAGRGSSKAKKEEAVQPLVPIACEEARKLRGALLQDTTGASVEYVHNLKVRFSLPGPSAPAAK